MAKTKNTKRIPKLRFPEFNEKWEETQLQDIATFTSGGTPSKDQESYWDGDIPWISASSMRGHQFSKSELMITELGLQNGSKIAPKGTILLLVRGSMLYNKVPVGIVGRDVAFNQDVKSITVNSASTSNFILQWFLFKQNTLLNMVVGTGIGAGKLDTQDLKSISVYLPLLLEQEKIASFLSAVDEKIAQLTKKAELLEQYKKGVMQKIFSQQIRFKDDNGKNYPKWQEKKLGDILIFISTNSLSRKDLNYDSGSVKNIHYGDIHTTFEMGFDAAKENVPYVNEAIDLGKVTKEQFCQVGDVVIADASEDYNDIGKAIEICNLAGENILAGLHTFLGRDNTAQTANGFKGYLLQASYIRKQIQRIAQGISVLGISKTNLLKIDILLPSKDEQVKIAHILKDIDNKIETVRGKLKETQTFKKGLLQQLFV